MKNRIILPALLCLGLVFPSCANDHSRTKSSPVKQAANTEKPGVNISVELPEARQNIIPGKTFALKLNISPEGTQIDSIQVYLGAGKAAVLMNSLSSEISAGNVNPANTYLRVRAFLSDSSAITASVPVKIVSDIVPVNYTYRVIREYHHDIKAYTQGLEYVDGYLFEGTGNYGESSLRKEDLNTGEILKFRNLPSDIFGEGITYLNNKIYQITYKSQVGFVYNANNFEVLQKIYYQNKEGWGLCNNGSDILMSDGTNVIYYMDTTYFSVEKKIQVFDNKGEVDLINEMELINGKLYANRYTTNEIVIIDPETGKVEGKIDMSGILRPEDRHPNINYFNGIAYDKKGKRIFVTGKYWPKLYQVEFVAVK